MCAYMTRVYKRLNTGLGKNIMNTTLCMNDIFPKRTFLNIELSEIIKFYIQYFMNKSLFHPWDKFHFTR